MDQTRRATGDDDDDDDDRELVCSLREVCTKRQINARQYTERLASSSSSSLSEDAFEDLLGGDTTFGQYGMPIAQQDPFLNVVALTAFQPYDQAALDDPHDVVVVLTPIYRILCTLAVITMRRSGFEEYDQVPLDRLLPYKPRKGHQLTRYASLLEIVCSVWTRICHAYCWNGLIKSLHCFNPNQERSVHVWLDIDTRHIGSPVDADREWFSARTCPENLSLVIALRDAARPGVLMSAVEQERIVEQKLCAGDDAYDVAFLRTREQGEWVVLLSQAGTTKSFYLLVTLDGGEYAGFHRITRDGTVVAYPLHMHPLSEAEPLAADLVEVDLDDQSSSSSSSSQQSSRCSACGVSGVPLIRDDDARQFCSLECRARARRIDMDKRLAREVKERQATAERSQFPTVQMRQARQGLELMREEIDDKWDRASSSSSGSWG